MSSQKLEGGTIMSIESLVGRIIEDAEKASSEIEQRALEEVKTCEQMAERDVQGVMDAAKERAARSAEDRKQRMITMAQLKTKQELIEEAFSMALEKILSLDTAAYGAFLIRLILQANPEGDEEVLLNQRDRERFGNGWIKGLNEHLTENKKKGEMRIAGEFRSIRGGAVLRRGRKEINCSFESVFGSKRNQLEAHVAGILFKDSE
jgi:V/A-type H+-transporting ATPase subunit E